MRTSSPCVAVFRMRMGCMRWASFTSTSQDFSTKELVSSTSAVRVLHAYMKKYRKVPDLGDDVEEMCGSGSESEAEA